ncbi:MAG: hypothetical protein Q7R70_03890 [Candidatus Diapherotrites archaeon]|nr:hypothetical protein [Candidatus Diapherotrites archaeon]
MKKQESEDFEKFCPNCSSTDLELYQGGIMGRMFKCKKCGYIGPVMEKKVLK